MIERLSDLRPCPDDRPCLAGDGSGTACMIDVDEAGVPHSLCVIPQAGTRMDGCDPSDPDGCGSPASVHLADGAGWYWVPSGDPGPHVAYTDGLAPAHGSVTYLSCCP